MKTKTYDMNQDQTVDFVTNYLRACGLLDKLKSQVSVILRENRRATTGRIHGRLKPRGNRHIYGYLSFSYSNAACDAGTVFYSRHDIIEWLESCVIPKLAAKK